MIEETIRAEFEAWLHTTDCPIPAGSAMDGALVSLAYSAWVSSRKAVDAPPAWMPIESAPRDDRDMFVVRAFNVKVKGGTVYTSDPYCVWNEKGQFIRWPHKFTPTHWMPVPKAP